MDTQLLTLSKIFSERLFRIPDYQRGYAWGDKQLREFWSDIQQLDSTRTHYTGVLTLENVPEEVYSRWNDDQWIVRAKSFQPYFVVDGQQRLTTAIVLIQAILESIGPTQKLNFTSRSEIQRRFIFDSKDEGISRSYIFGYEKDNPSYDFLKARVFGEELPTSQLQETVYTQNLLLAKRFFAERVSSLPLPELEVLYRKVTQHLLFNIFTISDDVDVCVAFETMNNRGKPLSYLELLKNRLIYLSLRFDEEEFEREKLRRVINDCWKHIYHNLGRNKDQPLNDDQFLRIHYLVYFSEAVIDDGDESGASSRRRYRFDYVSDLLETRFISKNVSHSASDDDRLSVKYIYDYVNSLKASVVTWYKLWNPFESDFSEDVKMWLDKINRLGKNAKFGDEQFDALTLTFFESVAAEERRLAYLQAVEKALFIRNTFRVSDWLWDNTPLRLAIDLRSQKCGAEHVIRSVSNWSSDVLKHADFRDAMLGRFQQSGFYSWSALRYFMFEYNLELQMKSKTMRPKILWPEFSEHSSDFVSVEHIYPQNARHEYWTSRFDGLSQRQRDALRNSLGNLLPLSKPKNSSLSNKPFPEKVEGPTGQFTGYRYGSYAENEVAALADWTPQSILERGIRLLTFMERRWGIDIGDDGVKRFMLGLEFMRRKDSD